MLPKSFALKSDTHVSLDLLMSCLEQPWMLLTLLWNWMHTWNKQLQSLEIIPSLSLSLFKMPKRLMWMQLLKMENLFAWLSVNMLKMQEFTLEMQPSWLLLRTWTRKPWIESSTSSLRLEKNCKSMVLTTCNSLQRIISWKSLSVISGSQDLFHLSLKH